MGEYTMKEYAGACPYCGQMQIINSSSDLSDAQVERLAVLQCNCVEALAFQRCDRKKNYADANIEKLFAEDSEQLKELLLGHTDALSRKDIKKVVITTEKGIRASLTAKDGSIRVERTEVDTRILED